MNLPPSMGLPGLGPLGGGDAATVADDDCAAELGAATKYQHRPPVSDKENLNSGLTDWLRSYRGHIVSLNRSRLRRFLRVNVRRREWQRSGLRLRAMIGIVVCGWLRHCSTCIVIPTGGMTSTVWLIIRSGRW